MGSSRYELGPPPPDADSFYIQDARKIQDNIATIQQATLSISKLSSDTIDSEELDRRNVQKEMHEHIKRAHGVAVETQSLLRRFAIVIGVSPYEKAQRRLMHEKLSNSYRQALQGLEGIAQAHLSRESFTLKQAFTSECGPGVRPKEYEMSNSEWIDRGSSGSLVSTTTASQQQVLVQETNQHYPNEQYQVDYLAEQEAALWQLQQDVANIHEVYLQLATQISQQQLPLEAIAATMETSAHRGGDAVTELQVARTLQRSTNSRKMLIMAIGVGSFVMLIWFLFARL
eukprot:Filipodium_phascolosomae@DN5986_c0_g1_i1.p1